MKLFANPAWACGPLGEEGGGEREGEGCIFRLAGVIMTSYYTRARANTHTHTHSLTHSVCHHCKRSVFFFCLGTLHKFQRVRGGGAERGEGGGADTEGGRQGAGWLARVGS